MSCPRQRAVQGRQQARQPGAGEPVQRVQTTAWYLRWKGHRKALGSPHGCGKNILTAVRFLDYIEAAPVGIAYEAPPI
jgi:hypothetical protein